MEIFLLIKMSDKKYRNWWFTINNPGITEREEILEWDVKFVKFQLEKEEKSGTPYYKGMVIMHNTCRWFTDKKSLHARADFTPMQTLRGSLAYIENTETRVDGPWQAGIQPEVKE